MRIVAAALAALITACSQPPPAEPDAGAEPATIGDLCAELAPLACPILVECGLHDTVADCVDACCSGAACDAPTNVTRAELDACLDVVRRALDDDPSAWCDPGDPDAPPPGECAFADDGV